ncbi:MAG: GNAT family N-acetyltransferase [Hyphomicrobiales bacterium]
MPSTAILANFEDDSVTETAARPAQWALRLKRADALDQEDLTALDDLITRAGEDRSGNVFFEPRAVLASSPLSKQPIHWLLWSHQGRLCFAAPVIVWKLGGLSFLKIWTHTYAPLGTPLITEPFQVQPFLTELVQQGFSALVCPWLETDSVLAKTLADDTSLQDGIWSCQAERVFLTSDWTLDSSLSKQRQKKLRKMRRQVDLTHRELRGEAARDDGFRQFCDLEAMGWKGEAGSALKQRETSLHFAQELLAGHAARDTLVIDSLDDLQRSDDQSVAMTISFEQAGRGVIWKIGHHTDYDAVSPGYQLILTASERFVAGDSDIAIDSLAGPEHPMVGWLWPGRLTVGTLVIPLAGSSVQARLLSQFYELENRLRTVARAVRQRLRG